MRLGNSGEGAWRQASPGERASTTARSGDGTPGVRVIRRVAGPGWVTGFTRLSWLLAGPSPGPGWRENSDKDFCGQRVVIMLRSLENPSKGVPPTQIQLPQNLCSPFPETGMVGFATDSPAAISSELAVWRWVGRPFPKCWRLRSPKVLAMPNRSS